MAFGSMAPEIYYDPMTGLPLTQPEVPTADITPAAPQSALSKVASRLVGLQPGEPRMQLWPEKLVRSALTLPGDVMSGEQPILPPGLRREDYTDVPAPQAPTEDSTWLGRATGIAPVAAQPNDPAYERAQDTAGIAGGGMVFGGLARPAAETGVRVLGRQLMSDTAGPGAPLAALEAGKALAVERRNRGWNTGKMAEGHNFRRPDPTDEFDRLHATARGAYEAQRPAPESPLMTPEDRAFVQSGKFYEDTSLTGAPVAALEKVSAPSIVKTKLFDADGNPIPGAAYTKEARAVLDDIAAGPKGAGPMDLSTQALVPDVPQVGLPRYVPPRGISPRMVEALQNPEVRAGLADSMEAGRGVANWYHTDPVRRAFIDELGPANGQSEFKRFMDTVAATSPRSDVPTNIRNASYYYQAGSPENLPAKNPYPYGHVAQKLHRGNFGSIAGEGWNPMQNPKPASFAENLAGNLEPVTVDTHAFRNIGMRTGDPRFLETSFNQLLPPGVERGPGSLASRFGELTKNKKGQDVAIYRPQKLVKEGRLTVDEAKDIPSFWASKPKDSEYAAAEALFRETGNNLGLRPADAQAAAWAGGGEMTGLGTVGTHTFPELMNERVLFTARMRGENPQKTLSDFISGRATLLEDSAATGAPLSALEKGPAGAYHGLLDQPPGEAYKPSNAPEAQPATREAPPAPGGRDVAGGAGGGDAGLSEAQAAAARRAGAHKPLEGLPTKAMKIGDEHFVPGPIASVKEVAAKYMADRPKSSYFPEPDRYHPHDPEHATAIAKAFDEMKHTPNDPATRNSYKAMIDETLAQYQAIKESGLKIEAIPEGMPDPYAKNPRLAAKDVADNNHLWFFPTDQGFGSGGAINLKKHPMMQKTGEKLDGRELLANDVFRVVHDYFGHLKEGHGFRAAGEDNAWRSHAAMYSDLARPAMTTETRGQNSWVNFGPHGEKNRTASGADTVYADQKVGLLPEWTMRDRGSPEPTIVYHGSPHGFSQFDMSKIGTGEGAQVFGHGLYTAENPKVAKMYRDQLSRNQTWEKNGEVTPLHHVMEDLYQAMHLPDHMPLHPDQSGQIIKQITDLMEKGKSVASIRKNYDGPRGFEPYWNAALDRAETYKYNLRPGHTYEAAIDVPREEFLDWNKPFSEQNPKIQEAVRPILEAREDAQRAARAQIRAKAQQGDRNAQRTVERWKPMMPIEKWSGEEIHKALGLPARDPDEMRLNSFGRMKQMGIPGIKYLDQGSRGRGLKAGKTYNYVTHDEPRILKRYAVPGLIGGGMTFGSMARDEK